jgi:zinc protease
MGAGDAQPKGAKHMKRSYARAGRLAAAILAAALVAGPLLASDAIVDHPDKLTFKDLTYQPPKPDAYRHTLKCGAPAYVGENHDYPTFDLTILVRTGSAYEPREKAGLADMTAYLMRNGGVAGMTAAGVDERLAYLAGEISVNIDDIRGQVSLFCLSKDIDAGLELLAKVLRQPAFDQGALDRYRTDVLSELERDHARGPDRLSPEVLLPEELHPGGLGRLQDRRHLEEAGQAARRLA